MKNAKKFLFFCGGIIVLLLCFILSGCSFLFADFVPETFGAPEGLYLYKGNIRSFTDGSEPTEILSEITLGERTYGPDEFEIISLAYITETHEIFYLVSVDQQYSLWHVNYKSKVSELLYEFPKGERANLKADDYYVLAQSSTVGVLFDKNAEMISDAYLGFALEKDVVYKIDNGIFEFWKDGKTAEVKILLQPKNDIIFYLGDYFYIFGEEKAVSVSLTSGKTVYLDMVEYSVSPPQHGFPAYGFDVSRVMDDALFFVLYGNYNTLWKAENGSFEILHTYSDENCIKHKFDNRIYKRANLEFNDYGKGILNFRYSCSWYKGGVEEWYDYHDFYYNAKNGKVRRGRKSVPKSKPEALTVGGYKFYISERHSLTGRYYYLNREKNGKKEIVQYMYKSEDGSAPEPFYDDICEF